MIFLLRLLYFSWLICVGLYFSFLLYPDCHKLSSEHVVDSLNIISIEDRYDRQVSIEAGICLIIFGGDWILYVCTVFGYQVYGKV